MPNGILIVDKPSGWTSHDVVAKLRGLLGERRVGHCGTLDPMATGVLPVFAGRATRAVSFAAEGEKEYIAWMKLGIVTDTQDSTGTILEENPVSATEEDVEPLFSLSAMKYSRFLPCTPHASRTAGGSIPWPVPVKLWNGNPAGSSCPGLFY